MSCITKFDLLNKTSKIIGFKCQQFKIEQYIIFKFYHSKNMNKNLKFEHNMHNSKTHWMMSKSFRYLKAFSCKLKKLKKSPGNKVFLWLDDFIKKLFL